MIGRMGKGFTAQIAFDLNAPMGNSSCVSCGECMISCPTGALTNRGPGKSDRERPAAGRRGRPAEELIQLPLFAGVSRPFLRLNENAVIRRDFKKGEIICREGEFGSTAFYIEQGQGRNLHQRLLQAHQDPGGNANGGLFGLVHRLMTVFVSRKQTTATGRARASTSTSTPPSRSITTTPSPLWRRATSSAK